MKLTAIFDEIGLGPLWRSPLDTKLLCAQRFVRLFAYGGATLILASYLSALDISDDRIGLFMSLTLVGDVLISFGLTLFADAVGRRAVLLLGSALMCMSGLVFAFCGDYWVLLAAAVFGVISPSGNEIGPFRAVEESTIAHITATENMSDILTWYLLAGNAGTALGLIGCGWTMTLLQESKGWGFVAACRVVFLIYAAAGAAKLLLTVGLSSSVEAAPKSKEKHMNSSNGSEPSETEPLLTPNGSTPASEVLTATEPTHTVKRSIPFLPGVEPQFVGLVTSLILLFGLDSFASGLGSVTWVTYFFHRKFDVPEGRLGSLFSIASVIQGLSMLVASSIAKRIGNIKTMVFTHLPSSLCLAMIPIPSSLPLAMTFVILRACSQNMDVAPRSTFLATALPPNQRTAIMGTLNVAKTCTSSVAPLLTGVLASRGLLWVTFVMAGVIKAVYDVGMLVTFAETDRRAGEEATEPEDEEA